MNNLLHEIPRLKQTNRSLVKRWFTSREMDLFVCFHDSWPHNSRQLAGTLNEGFNVIGATPVKPSLTAIKNPTLIGSCDQQELAIIAGGFLLACENIDVGIADFIYARLLEYPSIQTKHNVEHTGHHTVT